MNLVEFVRLLSRHKIFLIATPVVMILLVYLMTSHELQVFSSKATIYTGITSGYSIDSQDNTKVDFYRANAAYDNLLNLVKSRATMEEVSLRLLAQHLSIKGPENGIISKGSFDYITKLIPGDIKKLTGHDFNTNLTNLKNARSEEKNSFLYGIFNYSVKYYSQADLSKVTVKRLNNSDIIELTYATDDPGICKNTLLFLTEVVTEKYKAIKEDQSSEVYKYFVKQLAAVEGKLNNSEDMLQKFNVDNDIINYYEQTKFVADRHEKLDAEYTQEKMLFSAADSAMKKLEVNMNLRQKLIIKNTEILAKRNELAGLNFKLSMLETSDSFKVQKKYHDELLHQATAVKNDMLQAISSLSSLSYTEEGLTSNEMLLKWLDNMIKYEEGKARVKIMEEYRENFLKRYKLFAPLGAEMKRIERKINVHEQEYLSVLYGLNLSKLKQQSLEMSTNLKTVDAPFLPIRPEASKRKMVVVASGLAGFLLALAIVFFSEYFDSSIKTPENAKKLSGLEVAGMCTAVLGNGAVSNDVNGRLSQLLIKKILLTTTPNPATGPVILSILSTKHGEGKTFVSNLIADQLQKFAFKPLVMNYDEQSGTDRNEGIDHETYSSDVSLFKSDSLTQIVNTKDRDIRSYDFIIFEVPAILDGSFPLQLLKESSISLLVCKASRAWKEADIKALELIHEAGTSRIFMILNGIEPHVSEAFLGEIDKKRSWLRKKVKQLLMFEFKQGFKTT
jgi:polysaccharide biosynthesis transport protein